MAGIDFRSMIKRVPIDKVRPNPWNPAKQNEEQLIQRAMKSIADIGFCGAVIVRQRYDGHTNQPFYEIVDGEHRYIALKKMDAEECTIINLGEMTEHEAKMLTLNMNLIQGEMLAVDVANLLREVVDDLPAIEMERLSVLDDAELKELLAVAEIDWERFATQDESTRIVNSIRRVFVFKPDAHRIIVQGLARAMERQDVKDEADALAHVCETFVNEREEVTDGSGRHRKSEAAGRGAVQSPEEPDRQVASGSEADSGVGRKDTGTTGTD